MKKVKTILLRGLFYLVALQILNLSIDLDYIANTNPLTAGMENFDDIDSFGEFLIEKVLGDDDYTSEEDNDSGGPQEKGIEKTFTGPLCYEQYTNLQINISSHSSTWTTGLDQDNKTCKGYFNIVSPPPDLA